jgi:ribonuclease HI
MGIYPVHLRIHQLAMKSYIRTGRDNGGWEGQCLARRKAIGHLKYWETRIAEVGEIGEIDVDTGNCNGTNNFNVNLASLSEPGRFQKQSQINVYTDGSKCDGKVGWGFQIYMVKVPLGHDFARLPDWATVFQAEVMAIKMAAIRLLNEPDWNVKYVKFFSDSQAAILALNDRDNNQCCVRETKEVLNRLVEEKARYVTLVWTKAHVGTVGNERADELAKEGTKAQLIESLRVPMCEVKGRIENHIIKLWNEEWRSYNEARMSKQFVGVYDKKRSRAIMKFGRSRVGTIVRAITGHNGLRYFRSKVDGTLDPTCRFCEEENETFWHLVAECPVFINKSREVMISGVTTDSWAVHEVVEFLEYKKIAVAFEDCDEIWYEEEIRNEDVNNDSPTVRPDPEPD